MKDFAVWMTSIITIVSAFRVAYQVWRKEISPALSTWIIFLAATGLSLGTYAIAENHDYRSGVLNTVDVAAIVVVLLATLVWGDRAARFRPFEKWYLAGTGVITLYGMISGDAWTSNLFTQALISIGYLPTLQALVAQKRNTESFTGWGLFLAGGVVALYPAFVDGNTLAAIYAVRTIVLIGIVLLLMAYYEIQTRGAAEQSAA